MHLWRDGEYEDALISVKNEWHIFVQQIISALDLEWTSENMANSYLPFIVSGSDEAFAYVVVKQNAAKWCQSFLEEYSVDLVYDEEEEKKNKHTYTTKTEQMYFKKNIGMTKERFPRMEEPKFDEDGNQIKLTRAQEIEVMSSWDKGFREEVSELKEPPKVIPHKKKKAPVRDSEEDYCYVESLQV